MILLFFIKLFPVFLRLSLGLANPSMDRSLITSSSIFSKTSFPDGLDYTCLSSSSDGKYIGAVSKSFDPILVSKDFGVTISEVFVEDIWETIAVSSSGQYFAAAGLFLWTSFNSGDSFTIAVGSLPCEYNSISISRNDDNYQVATGNFGTLVVSYEKGNRWFDYYLDDDENFKFVAISAIGNYITIVSQSNGDDRSGRIYTLNNYNFMSAPQLIPVGNFQVYMSIAMSNNGMYQATVFKYDFTYYGGYAISINYGASFNYFATSSYEFTSITMDSTGRYMNYVIYKGGIYISSDFGSTFLISDSAPNNANWKSIASDSSGSIVVAAVDDGRIYTTFNIPTPLPTIIPSSATSYPIENTLSPMAQTLSPSNVRSIDKLIWTPEYAAYEWVAIAISGDGKYQVAGVDSGYLYISLNYGETWQAASNGINSAKLIWQCIAVSMSGMYILVGALGYSYLSSNFGSSWTAIGALNIKDNNWSGVGISSSGQYQAACDDNVYSSTNYGSTWITTSLNENWKDVAVSSSGQYQTAIVVNGKIYISNNYGSTWIPTASSITWWAISIQGQYQTSVVYNGYIYVSSDYGYNWAAKESIRYWNDVSVSADSGKYQVAVPNFERDSIYISFDFGETWLITGPQEVWSSVAISFSGESITAVGELSQIYITNPGTSFVPSGIPTVKPTSSPSEAPTPIPSSFPSAKPTCNPSYLPTSLPTAFPTTYPTQPVDPKQYIWAPYGASLFWSSIAMSYNGQIQVATVTNGQIYYSNNYGYIWILSTSSIYSNWKSVSVSYSGLFQLAINDNSIYSSTNGDIWALTASFSGLNDVSIATGESSFRYCTVVGTNNIYVSSNQGATWSSNYIPGLWNSAAISATGQYQVATAYSGYIYISSSYGLNWESIGYLLNWNSIAISGDSVYISATVENEYIYASSDSGDNWTKTAYSQLWSSITMSLSGKYQVAAVRGGFLWVTTDYCKTWIQTQSYQLWTSVAISQSASTISAVIYGGYIYIENPSTTRNPTVSPTTGILGVPWNPVTEIGVRNWTSVAVSSDGSIIASVISKGGIFVSYDYGNSWFSRFQDDNWANIAISFDGSYMTAVVHNGLVYTSADSGNTWKAALGIDVDSWNGVALNDDGRFQIVVSSSGNIYSSIGFGVSAFKRLDFPYTGIGLFKLSISSEGKYTSIIAETGYIYRSSDTTVSWTIASNLGSSIFLRGIALSSSGAYQVVVASNYYIYRSSDYGVNWVIKGSQNDYSDVAISLDGQYQSVTVKNGYIMISSNYGDTFSTAATINNWISVAMSKDAVFRISAVNGGYLYTIFSLLSNSTKFPSSIPTYYPTSIRSSLPSKVPSSRPTSSPTVVGSICPTAIPSRLPSTCPSYLQSLVPTGYPTHFQTTNPTSYYSSLPSSSPSRIPTRAPSSNPSSCLTSSPSRIPTRAPSSNPSSCLTLRPTVKPSVYISYAPTKLPTTIKSIAPTSKLSSYPSALLTQSPTHKPSLNPTVLNGSPTPRPSSNKPSTLPSKLPSISPTDISKYVFTFYTDIEINNFDFLSTSIRKLIEGDVQLTDATINSITTTVFRELNMQLPAYVILFSAYDIGVNSIIVRLYLSFPNDGFYENMPLDEIYETATTNLNDAILSGEFTNTLQYESLVFGSTQTQNAGVSTEPIFGGYPPRTPTDQPVSQPNVKWSKTWTIFIASGVSILVIALYLIWWLRSNCLRYQKKRDTKELNVAAESFGQLRSPLLGPSAPRACDDLINANDLIIPQARVYENEVDNGKSMTLNINNKGDVDIHMYADMLSESQFLNPTYIQSDYNF